MRPAFRVGNASVYHSDCVSWLHEWPERSVHGVVTDPPYGIVEYTPNELRKLRSGSGGVWRIPPTLGGVKRSPVPRFTVLTAEEVRGLYDFFHTWAQALLPVLVPGAHVLIASNPLFSHVVSAAVDDAGFERRGEIIRLVTTMRGGDRPKNAHEEFPGVTVMPRSHHEPWVLFRVRIEGRVQDNLRAWKTGGLRRPNARQPFGDVIKSAPASKAERSLAAHPSLKPQSFLRAVTRAILPLGEGVVLDPFAGSGSTLAACNYLCEHEGDDYESIGVELDPVSVDVSRDAIMPLSRYAAQST